MQLYKVRWGRWRCGVLVDQMLMSNRLNSSTVRISSLNSGGRQAFSSWHFFFLEISVHWLMAMISIITVEVVAGFLHVHKLFIATTQHTKDRTLCFICYCKKLCLLHWSSLGMSGLSSGKTDLFLCKTFFFVSLSDCCKKNWLSRHCDLIHCRSIWRALEIGKIHPRPQWWTWYQTLRKLPERNGDPDHSSASSSDYFTSCPWHLTIHLSNFICSLYNFLSNPISAYLGNWIFNDAKTHSMYSHRWPEVHAFNLEGFGYIFFQINFNFQFKTLGQSVYLVTWI